MKTRAATVLIGMLWWTSLGFSQIGGTTLGFTADLNGSAIRPIPGIPGAAIAGDPLAFDVALRIAVVSPKQDYAIAAGAEDGRVRLINLTGESPVMLSIEGVRDNPEAIVLSASGTAAGFYNAETRTVQLIGGLPVSPMLRQEFDVSAISGHPAILAVSDDARMALMKFTGDENVTSWAFSGSGASLLPVEQASAAVFMKSSSGSAADAIVTDDAARTVYWIRDIGGAEIRMPVLTVPDSDRSFSSVAVSDDGRRVLLADDYGTVAIVDLQTRLVGWANCDCRPLGLSHLEGNSIYRLNEPFASPMKAVDASSSEPQVLIIPVKTQPGPEHR
jgi:hypothetical protein